MNRTLAALGLIGLCITPASAVLAQSVPLVGNGVSTATQQYTALPSVARDPKGTTAPQNGTAEEAYVKEHMRAAGYSGVNSLYRDGDGTWHALAYMGPADVELAFDQSGHITAAAHQ